jgi:DNA-binding CsgD family transcriptional regulator
MEALSPGLIAEIACSAPDWADIEKAVVPLLADRIGADVVFFAGHSGFGEHTLGVDTSLRADINAIWADCSAGFEPLVEYAVRSRRAVIDAHFFGGTLTRLPYFHGIMRPLRGRQTLMGFLELRRRAVYQVALGRSGQSPGFCDRDRDLLSSLIPTLTLACAARADRPRSFLPSRLPQAQRDNCVLDLLTSREREVLDYLHLGYTNEQIGVALGTQPRTIRNQLTAVYRKLGVATRAEAVGLVASIGRQRRPLAKASIGY